MRNLLFFGELPPKTIHGIASANLVNLKMLSQIFNIHIVEEHIKFSDHGRVSLSKILNMFLNNFKILKFSTLHKYEFFYTPFSLSVYGGLKTLFAIISFKLFNKGKVILHIHRGDFFSRYYKIPINRFITKMIFHLSYKIIILSGNQKADFESLFKGTVSILYNTVETEFESPDKVRLSKRFIYVSNYLPDKGILDLLEVFQIIVSKHGEISLHTYGMFSDHMLEKRIMKYQSANININNTVFGLDKFEKIAESDCLVLPSWNEGQPIVLLEAMSVGTPVIASDVGFIAETVGYEYPYLFASRDKRALQETVERFIEDKSLNEVSNRLRNRYKMQFSQEMHATCLQEIFI